MSEAASCGGVPAPCVLAGDFNAAPGSAVYQLLQTGILHLNQFDVANVSGASHVWCLAWQRCVPFFCRLAPSAPTRLMSQTC
eukprot:1161850-Pelagomonas_calceolata.AAC.7